MGKMALCPNKSAKRHSLGHKNIKTPLTKKGVVIKSTSNLYGAFWESIILGFTHLALGETWNLWVLPRKVSAKEAVWDMSASMTLLAEVLPIQPKGF